MAQFGCSDSTNVNAVGSRIAAAWIDGGDVNVTHLPDATAPWIVAIPKLNASVNVDKTYAFTVTIAMATKILLTGLPVSTTIGVSGSGSGTITVTVSGTGSFTSTADGTLLVTLATNGTVS